jgi:hypothetical protein
MTAAIAIEVDGLEATWSPETGFAGHPDLVASALEASRGGYSVEWGNLPGLQHADADTALGALNALMYFRPGRTRITAWPDVLREWWERETIRCETPEPRPPAP